jgi:hypothetical protein
MHFSIAQSSEPDAKRPRREQLKLLSVSTPIMQASKNVCFNFLQNKLDSKLPGCALDSASCSLEHVTPTEQGKSALVARISAVNFSNPHLRSRKASILKLLSDTKLN